MHLAVRKTENCSAQLRIFCAKLHITWETVPPYFFIYATTAALLLFKTMDSPMIWWWKALKASWTACFSNTIWRLSSSSIQVPAALKSCVCILQPVLDAVVKAPGERLLMPTSPPVATIWYTTGILSMRGLVLQNCLSPVTRGNFSCHWRRHIFHPASGNKPLQRGHVAYDLLPYLCKKLQMKALVCHITEFDNSSLSGKPSLKYCLSAFHDTKPCWSAWGLTSPNW